MDGICMMVLLPLLLLVIGNLSLDPISSFFLPLFFDWINLLVENMVKIKKPVDLYMFVDFSLLN